MHFTFSSPFDEPEDTCSSGQLTKPVQALVGFLMSFFIVRALGNWLSTLQRTSIFCYNDAVYKPLPPLKRMTGGSMNCIISQNLPPTRRTILGLPFDSATKYPRSKEWKHIKWFFAWTKHSSFFFFLWRCVCIYIFIMLYLMLCALFNSNVNISFNL